MHRKSLGMGSTGPRAAAANAPAVRAHRWRVAATVLVAAILASCGDDNPAPTSPSPPVGADVVRVEVTGPETIALGTTGRFAATAHMSDGTSRDVTSLGNWLTSNNKVLSMERAGEFTGRSNGEVSVSVSYGRRSATIGSVIVVPAGTYRLVGTIRDSGVPVEASVRVENSVLGVVNLTAADHYAVYGVAGDTQVTVTKAGYQDATRRENVTAHQRLDVELQLAGSRPSISGAYTLTITAAGSCASLPADLRTRSFAARLEQTGAELSITLSGADFANAEGAVRNHFTGFLEAARATFRLASTDSFYYYYFYLPDVMEVVSDHRFYSIEGAVTLSIEGSALSGTLNGYVNEMLGPPYYNNKRCLSTSHGFTLTKGTT